MTLIPWKYLEKHIVTVSFTPSELTEKLTVLGLETNSINQDEEIYLDFTVLPNRPDLLS